MSCLRLAKQAIDKIYGTIVKHQMKPDHRNIQETVMIQVVLISAHARTALHFCAHPALSITS